MCSVHLPPHFLLINICKRLFFFLIILIVYVYILVHKLSAFFYLAVTEALTHFLTRTGQKLHGILSLFT